MLKTGKSRLDEVRETLILCGFPEFIGFFEKNIKICKKRC